MIPSHLPNREHGITGPRILPGHRLRLTLSEHAPNVCEAPQLAGTR